MEGPVKQPDRLDIIGIIVIGTIGAVAVYASFIALQAFYNAEASRVEAARESEGKGLELRTLRERQEGELRHYKWVSQERQIVSLPIERSMDLVVTEIRNGTPSNLVPAVGRSDMPTSPVILQAEEPMLLPPAGNEGEPPAEGAQPAEGEQPAGDDGAQPAGEAAAAGAGN